MVVLPECRSEGLFNYLIDQPDAGNLRPCEGLGVALDQPAFGSYFRC